MKIESRPASLESKELNNPFGQELNGRADAIVGKVVEPYFRNELNNGDTDYCTVASNTCHTCSGCR